MLPSLVFIIASFLAGPQENEEIVDETSYVVIYNIQDLEMIIPDYTNAPELDLNSVLNGNNQGSPFTNTQNQQQYSSKNSQAIINLIESIVEPDVWGDTSSIRYWNGNLIINAPKRIHDQIK